MKRNWTQPSSNLSEPLGTTIRTNIRQLLRQLHDLFDAVGKEAVVAATVAVAEATFCWLLLTTQC